MKNHLKSRNFRLLWKLANIVTHLKKMCDLFFFHSFPRSVTSRVYTTFPQLTQKILITDTCSWLEVITVIVDFLEIFTFIETNTHFRTIFLLKVFLVQGFNFKVQFWMDFAFPLMPIISSCENSPCV